VQLVVSLIIFGAALVVKLASPDTAEAVRAALADGAGGALDYRAAFATAGETLSAGGDIVTAFRVWTEELFGSRPVGTDPSPSEETGARPPGTAGAESEAAPAPGAAAERPAGTGPAAAPGQVSGAAAGAAPEGTSVAAAEAAFGVGADGAPAAETTAAERSEASQRAAADAVWRVSRDAAAGADAAGAVWVSDWTVSLSAEDALDDTAPVPFGTEVPERADYTWYPLPFAHSTPLQGVVSSGFGFRRHPVYGETLFHYGLDLAADTGAEIHCFADGTVLSAGFSDTYGYCLEVDHGDGFTSFYAHCSRLLVKTGQAVSRDAPIARVGMTGLATGPHLHFELRLDGVSLAPDRYLGLSDNAARGAAPRL
jgi:murein DD-endopeptidase MepM/ murein hydrolase activator NlpD